MTSLPDNILHLPEYHVLGTKMEEHDLHYQVEAPEPLACEECGVESEFVRFGKRDVAYRDLPIHGRRVTLWVVRRRYTCRACGRTFRPALPEMVDDHRMTRRLYNHVEKEAFNHPYAYVADTTGLDEKTVREIFKKKAEFLAAWHRFETPRCLGIDELYLNRRYRCILTNLEERTLLDLLPGRQQDAVTRRLMSMTERHQVEIVSMDMWKPYRRAVQAVLPQARIVVDKFHVVRMANEALEKVRKGLRKKLTSNQRRTLKGDRKILLKRAHDVSDRERLIMETWTGAFPQLLAAYEHKERFFHIWDATTRRDAEKALTAWIDDIPQGQKEVWKDLVSAISGWHEEMLTYFETDIPITNAFTESINRLAKDKNRDGRGYSFEVMRARMLYTTKHKKKVPQTKESPFLGKATMTYSMGLPEPEKNYGVDLSTFWES
nr:ISL3 family transposase [uncultured Halomonas sp.]